MVFFFFFQAEDGIRDADVTGVQTCALPISEGQTGDVEVVQTYASGPHSEVNSIIWPNSEFDGDITVYGPEVKALVQRYLMQMLGELGAETDPDEEGRTLLESIELIIP